MSKNNIWETAEKEKGIAEYSALFAEGLYKKIASCNIKGSWAGERGLYCGL